MGYNKVLTKLEQPSASLPYCINPENDQSIRAEHWNSIEDNEWLSAFNI